MNNRGVTLMETMIVIIVIGVLATITTISISTIIENQREKVDQANAEFLGETISLAYMEGNITLRNGNLYNPTAGRGYTGTGSWFFEDMTGYITNRIVPEASVAQNTHNASGGTYRFLFEVNGQEVSVFYYDENRNPIVLHTFTLESY